MELDEEGGQLGTREERNRLISGIEQTSASEDEEDMLDLAFALTHTSRLGCQIIMTDELDGLTVNLPAATRNYLVRLGWSHGDQEIFSTEEMIAAFDLPQIGRSPARFDFAKLESLNGHYMRASSDRELLAAIVGLLPHLANGTEIGTKLTPAVREQVMAAMPELKERAKTLIDLVDAAGFIWATRPLALDDKASAVLTAEARMLLANVIPALASIEPWMAEACEQAVRAFAEQAGAKLGAVAQPLRAALTGRTTSPGIFTVLAVLGRQESLARLRDQAGPA